MTSAELHRAAKAQNIKPRTAAQVLHTLEKECPDLATARSMARLMVNFGNCTDEARQAALDFLARN